MDTKRKILFLALAVCIIFLPAFSVLLIDNGYDYGHLHHHHDCEHDRNNSNSDYDPSCPTCLKIELAKNSLRNLKSAGIVFYPSGTLAHSTGVVSKYSELNVYSLSPVALKVRFNS